MGIGNVREQWQMLLCRMTVYSLRRTNETIARWELAAKFGDGYPEEMANVVATNYTGLWPATHVQQLRGLLSSAACLAMGS
jgi:hypothetical protein